MPICSRVSSKSIKSLLNTSALFAAPFLAGNIAYAEGEEKEIAKSKKGFEEVVVVARRVEESLQTVPLAITNISAQDIESRGISSATDLSAMVPSLSVHQGVLAQPPRFALRGIRNGVTSYFAETPVQNNEIEYQLWDLSSVQAITGPQGTLFGRSSTGGSILFVPQKPTDILEGYIKGKAGNYNYREAEGVLNVPINDSLKVRLGAQLRSRDGLVENVASDDDEVPGIDPLESLLGFELTSSIGLFTSRAGSDLATLDRENYRLSLTFDPNEVLSNALVMNYTERDEHPGVQINRDGPVAQQPTGIARLLYTPVIYQQYLDEQEERGPRAADIPYPHTADETRYTLSNILSLDLGQSTLRYITGYANSREDVFTTIMSIPLPIVLGGIDKRTKLITQELQLLGNAYDDRLEYQTGIYYSHELRDAYAQLLAAGLAVGEIYQPEVNDPIPPENAEVVHYLAPDISKAIYGQITYHTSEDLALTAGLRYTEDKAKGRFSSYSGGDCALDESDESVDQENCVQTVSEKFSAVTYNLSADYTISPDILVYATTRKGYMSGGFNFDAEEQYRTYLPEHLYDLEMGLKGTWEPWGIPVRTNIATFYSKYQDILRGVTVETSDGRPHKIGLNAAEATLYGGQVELLVRPFSNLAFTANYGYLQSKYDEFVNPVVGDASGNSFAQAPEHTLSMSSTYFVNLPIGFISASVNYEYVSSTYSDDNNEGIEEAELPTYDIWGARLDWKGIFGSGFDAAIYGKNITDNLYLLNAQVAAPLGTVTNVYGDQRTYGLELKYNFGD